MQNEDYRVINDDLTIFETDVFYVKNVLRFYFLHAEQLWEECFNLAVMHSARATQNVVLI